MKKTLQAAIFISIVLVQATFAQDRPFFEAIAGRWEGTLEYQDYSSNKRVTLNTIITFKPAADGLSAEVFTIYDDFGKVYKSQSKERLDLAAKKFFDDNTEFSLESNVEEKLVLLGKTQDGNTVEPTRKTITFTKDTLTILKETRTPWAFRHVYTLKRIAEVEQPARILSAQQLQEDFTVFKKTLTILHPGLYRYNTPANLEKEFAELGAKLSQPIPESEFFLLVSQFTNKIKCGHTYANPYNQDKDLKERLFKRRNYLPFYFQIIDSKMIITANASAKDIPLGSEITSINGVTVKEILSKLLTVTKADGNNTMAHRLNSIGLNRSEAESYALFDWYFPLFFPLQDEVYTLEAVDFTTRKPVKFQVLAVTQSSRTAEMARRYGPAPTYDDGWEFTMLENSTGYLKIDNSLTWRLKTIKFKEFLANVFSVLRQQNSKNLIIDLRGNGGGDTDVGFELARYLAQKKLPSYAASRRLVRNIMAQPDLLQHLDTYSDELKEGLRGGVSVSMYRRFDTDYFEIIGQENYPSIEPYTNNFLGKAFIIAEAGNASATFQFLDYVKTNKLAKIIGQSSGGNQQGINGGNYFFLSLPNSKIEIDIPVYFQAPLKMQKDSGVIPDVIVKQEPKDIGDKFDRELAEVKRLIQ